MRIAGVLVAPITLVVLGAFAALSACSDPKPAAKPRKTDETAAFAEARAAHKGVMVVFEAAWCVPCVELDRALRDKAVAPLVEASFVPLAFDVSAGTDADRALQDKYASNTLPMVVFVSTTGDVLGRVDRVLDPPELAERVRAAAAQLTR